MKDKNMVGSQQTRQLVGPLFPCEDRIRAVQLRDISCI